MQNVEAEQARSRARLAELIFVKIPYVITGTLFLTAIAINFANVIARYFFFQAFFWAEEVLIYMTLWGVILAAGTITYQGLHIKMDLFSTLFPSPFREIVGALTVLVMVGASIFVVMQSYHVVRLFFLSGERSISAGIPLTIPHIAVPIGFALIAIAVLVRLRSYITGRFE